MIVHLPFPASFSDSRSASDAFRTALRWNMSLIATMSIKMNPIPIPIFRPNGINTSLLSMVISTTPEFKFSICQFFGIVDSMKIYLIRHGQTTGDVEDRYGGDYDDHLTDLGIRQAENLADEMKDAGIERIFSSPLARAHETADILSRKIGSGIEFMENLRERNRYGILTGMIKTEGVAKFPKLAEEVKSFTNTIEKAEEFNHFEARIIEAFYHILLAPFNTTAIVTHGGPLRVLASEVLGHAELKDQMEDCGWALVVNSKDGSLTIEKTKGFLI